jgi:excisionase family DNA binding protein
MNTLEAPELLTVAEVALRFKVTRRTIDRWIRDADLPHVRVTAGTIRVPADELDRWLEERKR